MSRVLCLLFIFAITGKIEIYETVMILCGKNLFGSPGGPLVYYYC